MLQVQRGLQQRGAALREGGVFLASFAETCPLEQPILFALENCENSNPPNTSTHPPCRPRKGEAHKDLQQVFGQYHEPDHNKKNPRTNIAKVEGRFARDLPTKVGSMLKRDQITKPDNFFICAS